MKLTLFILCCVGIVVGFYFLGGERYFDLSVLSHVLETRKVAVAQNLLFYLLLSGLIFTLVMSTPLPATALSILSSGYLFGFWLGLALMSVSTLCAATITFLLCRYAVGHRIKDKVSQILNRFGNEFEQGGFWYALSLRLSALVPFFLLNCSHAITSLALRDFMISTFIGMIPITCVLLNAGTRLSEVSSLQDVLNPALLFSFVLVALLPILTRFVLLKMGFSKPQ